MDHISNFTASSRPTNNHNHDHHRHVVLFPFMSKGHTIPLLQLAHVLLKRRLISVTFFTTPANRPFIAQSLSSTAAAIVELPFPENSVPGVLSSVESTEGLPSMSLFHSFAMATVLMQRDFERALESLHPPATFIVSDAFLWWTLHSASKFGIPRFVSFGTSNYSMAINRNVLESGGVLLFRRQLETTSVNQNDNEEEEEVTVPAFPWTKVTRNDFGTLFSDLENNPVGLEFLMKSAESTERSSGLIVNSFYELEPAFADYWNRVSGAKALYVGPLCLAQPSPKLAHRHQCWLDEKLQKGGSVIYVAFGSQAELSCEQVKEIARGLEESKVNFFWVLRKKEKREGLPDGFEERVRNRGLVVRDWIDQRGILSHESVKGFLSHCGWNSVVESISAEVPILAWPMMAEQSLNAKMVADEIKVGLRVRVNNGHDSVKGLVKWESLEKMVRELMEGEKGKEVRNKVKEVAAMARTAMEEGGSSWQALESLINGVTSKQGSKNAAYDTA